MTTHTFDRGYVATTVSGFRTRVKGVGIVTIPDDVYEHQRAYDGKTFPVIRHDGTKSRARLRGELYGLWTSGTGDPIVSMA